MNDFVPYEHAVALKQLGFHEPCFRIQNNISHIIEEKGWLNWNEVEQFISLPLFSQAFRWFREKHNLFGCIDLSNSTPPYWWMRIDDIITNDYVYHCLDDKLNYPTYEAAEQACLTKLIEIVQNKEV
jgi:hypothetical protein